MRRRRPGLFTWVDVTLHELATVLDQARQAPLDEAGYQKLKAALTTLGEVARLLQDQATTIAHLRQLLGGGGTEKTRTVLKQAGLEAHARPPEPDGRSAPGHGRHGADAYAGARTVTVPHGHVHAGDRCPLCAKGKVYAQAEPRRLVRLIGQAPLAATVYALEQLRCNLCGEVFTANPPADVGPEKYDHSAASMIALLKYGSGVPFHRLAGLQANLQIPLPASTQWEIVAETAARLQGALDELIRQAAQGEVLHNDDTSMTVLSLRAASEANGTRGDASADGAGRTGIFTSGIVATREGQRIALFFTGRQHAGENLATVLAQRVAALAPPIQMCDALSRNLPKLPPRLDIIVANCLAHGRRQFVDVAPNFPDQCGYVLEALGEVYRYDAEARTQELSADARLHFHQAHSGPVMETLYAWLTAQLAEKQVEPNSGLGKAMSYLLRHWAKLTRFLDQPGAPLDNNVCERALKKAILHRKNALFYKTPNGAHVGDLFMSLIHTCELSDANPFDYLTALQQHAAALAKTPAAWMPWNYRDTVRRVGAFVDSG